ncbi:spermatogenesis-associated protein 17 [Genypterus blacodes]|uniref:spermatogenesis-associated protein 17 n=1 Tax=Genypterus blacodes TaxID=154954 RepID=UPI003F767F2A
MSQQRDFRTTMEEFQREYFHQNILAEENRQKENQAAMRIQGWFRACKLRVYLSHLHKKATIIQKIWRGFTARAHFRQMVKEAYFIMKMNFYNEMAVRIQSRWRGFCVRKRVHNYYARKKYLEEICLKNEFLRREMDEFEELQRIERECMNVVNHQKAMIYEAHRSHHLVSTKQRPGIYNSPFRPAPHEMELLLRQVKFPAPRRLSPRDRGGLLCTSSAEAPLFCGDFGSPKTTYTRACCSARPLLPPIVTNKPQGPFRQLKEVWDQRLRCPELSLRLQSTYKEKEEIQKLREDFKSSDGQFLPFSKDGQRNRRYEPLLHSSSSFAPLAYGTKAFREEVKYEDKEQFKTVFTTCNVFEKFGRLYSKAGNIV